MKRAVCPLIQLQIPPPPHLSSLTNWNFAKERLTQKEIQEEGSNQMLSQPFHPDLAQVDEKHPTQCVAAAVHFLWRKAAFKTAISQTKVAEKFRVAPKKLHEAITG